MPLLTILKNKKLVLALILILSTFWAGWEWRDREADAEMSKLRQETAESISEAHQRVSEAERELASRVAKVDEQNALISALRQRESQEITKEVIRYVQNPDIDNCTHNNEWVQLHDKAAITRLSSSGVPESASRTDDGSSTTSDIK